MPDYSIKVDVPLVNVDVMVTTKDGQFIPGMKKDNFRVFEDGVPQNDHQFQPVRGADHGGDAGRVCVDELLLHGTTPLMRLTPLPAT